MTHVLSLPTQESLITFLEIVHQSRCMISNIMFTTFYQFIPTFIFHYCGSLIPLTFLSLQYCIHFLNNSLENKAVCTRCMWYVYNIRYLRYVSKCAYSITSHCIFIHGHDTLALFVYLCRFCKDTESRVDNTTMAGSDIALATALYVYSVQDSVFEYSLKIKPCFFVRASCLTEVYTKILSYT